MSDQNSLKALLRRRPDETLDFLPSNATTRQIAETLVAFANGRGGILLLGVSRRGELSGLDDAEALVNRAIDAALASEPRLARSVPLPRVGQHEGRTLVMVEVPAGLSQVYRFEGRYLGRQGGKNEPLAGRVLRELLLARGETTFESLRAIGASPADLDWRAAADYASHLAGFENMPPAEVLRLRGCLTPDGQPTYAGLLLFGRHPQQQLPSAQILVARYPGRQMGDTFLRQVIDGPLPRQIAQAEAFVIDNMRHGAVMRGLQREEQSDYPREAVREAIVNAAAHRDYAIRGAEIQLFMFADRLEVRSPGQLPGHMTLQNILTERFSRNEVIVQVLSDLGFIERLGYGIDRMVRLMREARLPEPLFEETDNGLKLTLHGHGERLLSTDRETASRWAAMGLNERQERALAYLTEHGRITNRDYQALAPDVSPETIRRDLADLVDRGLLLRIGDKRATFYIFK